MLLNFNLCKIVEITFHKCHYLLPVVALTFMVPSAFGFEKESSAMGAWNLKCNEKVGGSSRECTANQLVTSGKSKKQVILGVMVGYLPEHEMPHIIFRMSATANLERGAAVKIDKFESFSIPISNCDKKVCEVRSFIPKALLSQMLNGKLLRFAFLLDNKPVTYPVSLEGFNNIYSALQSNLK
jgi:invasion protein IalB